MSKADDVFWRQFGVVLILLTLFGFAMYFVANAVGGQAYAKMRSNPAAVAERIAPIGQSRIGDPAGQMQAAAGADAVRTGTAGSEAPVTGDEAPTAENAASASEPVVVPVAAAGEKIYQTACIACHSTGAAGAPKLDDKAAWELRLGLGMDGLVQSVTVGKGAMPPKGGFMNLTEDDLRNAVAFMLGKAGLSAGG